MAMWRWLAGAVGDLRAQGGADLAETLVRLARMAVDGQAARIAEALPEALRAARADTAPAWAPPLLAHLALDARTGARAEGETALHEALARLRAAHAPGAAPPEHTGAPGGADPESGTAPAPAASGADAPLHACTPAACAAEPVLACYATIDGPGHVVERATIAAEGLAHVRPGEPAWEALVLARADMLVDDERPEEAVRELDLRAAQARAAGRDVTLGYAFGYVRALRHQDRHAEALAALERVEAGAAAAWPAGAPRAAALRRARAERARLLAWLARAGRVAADDALAALPDPREADAHPRLRRAWAEAAEHLVACGALANDWRLGVRLTGWARYFEHTGAHRPCLELALVGARLATERGARWAAGAALGRARRALGRVRRGADLAADLEEAARDLAARGPVALPVPAADVLGLLRRQRPEDVDPEHQADLVAAALEHRPHDASLLNALGQVGRTLQLADVAAAAHWPRVRSAPGDQKAALSLLETLLHDNDTGGVRALVRVLTEGALHAVPPAGHTRAAAPAAPAAEVAAPVPDDSPAAERDPAATVPAAR
ncbi:hypothetical protein LG943_11685 [Streptomonospora sp. S1-112]|uniref:Uncharacterized protein n=1 Tax=Streptomonospora mangrovi TaxID=2883123 RepID=A0A9X3NMX8_9ACTN|nr:hypothetical protein [Streptomonospora mangrovi]MDA0564976.1 hypothetical protein [Streptomonospora mangrovi]